MSTLSKYSRWSASSNEEKYLEQKIGVSSTSKLSVCKYALLPRWVSIFRPIASAPFLSSRKYFISSLGYRNPAQLISSQVNSKIVELNMKYRIKTFKHCLLSDKNAAFLEFT